MHVKRRDQLHRHDPMMVPAGVEHELYAWSERRDVLLNPDCRDGKHRSCNGAGWDLTNDIGTDCPCNCHAERCDPASGFHATPHRGCIMR